MARCGEKSQFSANEGHLEDVCHTEMWLQMYKRRAGEELECHSRD